MSLPTNPQADPTLRAETASLEAAQAEYTAGRSLILAGDLRRGSAHLQRALALKPNFAMPHVLWGQLLLQRGQYAKALDSFRQATDTDRGCAEAHLCLGTVLTLLGNPAAAVKSYDEAISMEPRQFRPHLLRGWALRQCDRLDEAVASLETALRLQPDFPQALAEALFSYAWTCDWAGVERMLERMGLVRGALERIEPSILMAFSDDPAQQARVARSHAARIGGNVQLPAPPRYEHDRIRIAYVSRDFYAHATAFLMAELFELHDRRDFEVIVVSFGGDEGSAVRRRIAGACDRFIEMRDAADHAIAAWLREEEVDVAIDLKGYTGFARPGIFALRPAPIQVNYLGHPGTLGAPFIDYLIADRFLIPSGSEEFYTESIAYLPDSYQSNDRKRLVAEATPSRAEVGLPAEGFVFCCFNNNWKITSPVFDAWMRILKGVDGSVLWLLGDNRRAIENLRREALRRGVTPERLVFAERIANDRHLARHRLADLFLDTLPCNAHTTASDALWSGVPIVTCAGRSFAARVAGSLLHAVGLKELVTDSLAQYEALALALARDRERLAALRQHLAWGREGLPLFDTPRFCGHLEEAYRHMWRTYRDGEPPTSFRVAPSGVCGPPT
ncbi:MAG TPA: tetratricopeptide repeat protein [Steroidobacteraceae bacterium]|jgi:predicted O-linked N-acetylglucosamine transferase (SPINDLY family)